MRNSHHLRDEDTGDEHSAGDEAPDSIPNPPEILVFRRPDLLRLPQRMTLYFRVSIFREIRDVLRDIGGTPLVERFMGTVMGRFMTIRRKQSTNTALHYLLARELTTPRGMPEIIPLHERWFFVSGRIIRFTPEAFCLITGLVFGRTNFDPTAAHELSKGSLYRKHFDRPIRADDLRRAFIEKELGTDSNDYLKAANLLVFYFFLLCRDKPPIEHWTWALVEDPERWEAYPWGAYTYLNLIYYIRNVAVAPDQLTRSANHFYGAVWAFQIWSYEAIPHLGRLCGKKDTEPIFPRCMMWLTDQSKVDFSSFFERPRLTLVEVLEPMPFEKDEYAWLSLHTESPFDVHFDPPVRIGHHDVDQPTTAPHGARARLEKNKGKVKESGLRTKTKEVVKSIQRRDTDGAGPSREVQTKMNEDRSQLKRHREHSGSGSPDDSLVCCLHGRPCHHREKEDRYMKMIDSRFRHMMDEMKRFFDPRVQTDRSMPQWDAFEHRGPSPR